MLSCEFCEISKNTFFKEHLCSTASGNSNFLFTIHWLLKVTLDVLSSILY